MNKLVQYRNLHEDKVLLWFEEPSKRLTDSGFGEICQMKKTTSPANKLKTWLYSSFSGNTKYGQDHTAIAIDQFVAMTCLKVEKCEFFIDGEAAFWLQIHMVSLMKKQLLK